MNIIKINNLYKSFDQVTNFGIKEFFLSKTLDNTYDKHNRKFAVEDLSFSIKHGEAVALLGHNGSGKSTTLSIISGVLEKSSGNVTINGSISSLLELTSGINVELTGIQNVYLYSSLLGIPLINIKSNIDFIKDFSELNSSFYRPVRTYSSGMIARLAFSILISRKSNILIIDEVFAVGDNSFKKKCHEYVRNFLNKNGTLLMVTHDLATVKEFCNRVIILDQGKKIYDGNVKNLNNFYVKK